jgi:hypothetical protein
MDSFQRWSQMANTAKALQIFNAKIVAIFKKPGRSIGD